MQGVTHMAGGAAFAAVYTLVAHPGLSIGQEAAIIGIGALGGLIPDIDHPNSKISHKLKPVSAVVSLMFSHRGFFHTPILYLVLWEIWEMLCPGTEYLVYGRLLFLGIASHLVLDSLNSVGIPMLFPFSKKRRHIAKIKTGSKAELVCRFCLMVVLGVAWGLHLGLDRLILAII